MFKIFSNENRDVYNLEKLRLLHMLKFFWPAHAFLNTFGFAIILLYGGTQVLNGNMPLGYLIIFIQYLPRIYAPITNISRFYAMVKQASASLERVFSLMDAEETFKESHRGSTYRIKRGSIEFKDVTFYYPTEKRKRKILKNITFQIEPEQKFAIVGPSGVGKSTIIKLLVRLYEPTSGEIYIDGVNIKEFSLSSLRQQIAIVTQEPFLFNASIEENIRFGKPEASEEEIISAIKAAHAVEFIQKFPDGLNTLIGERGVKLSVGEKQRLSLARAILANPKILVLDEPTASLDSVTESLIQDAINKFAQFRTTIIIAHRLTTIINADVIAVLYKGSVVEMGTHTHLLQRGRIYAKLYQKQISVNS